MCIKCLLLSLAAQAMAEATEQAASAESEEALALGEAIHETLAAAGTAQASQPEYDEYTLLEMEHNRADIRSMNARTIAELAGAAVALNSVGISTAGIERTLEELYYPAPPVNQEPQPVDAAPETPAHDDEMDPLPAELRAHIETLRAAGFDVDVIRIPL